MGYLPKKTLEDLEFFEVTEQIADFAITPMGKASCTALEPIMEPPVRFKDNAENYGFNKEDAIVFKIGEINSLKKLLNYN